MIKYSYLIKTKKNNKKQNKNIDKINKFNLFVFYKK